MHAEQIEESESRTQGQYESHEQSEEDLWLPLSEQEETDEECTTAV